MKQRWSLMRLALRPRCHVIIIIIIAISMSSYYFAYFIILYSVLRGPIGFWRQTAETRKYVRKLHWKRPALGVVIHTWACECIYIIWVHTPMTVANRPKRSADTRQLAHAQTRLAQCKYERVTYDLIYGSRFYGTRHATIIVMCALRFRMKLLPSMNFAICSFV